jgi:type IV pilus assembly protein PilW
MGPARARGTSLIELMIGLAVGLLVVAGAIALYVNSVQASRGNLELAHLNQQLRALMSLVTRDLRRACYYGGTPGLHDFFANPFTQGGNDLAVGAHGGEAAGSCVTYTYDLDGDRLVGVGAVSPLPAGADADNVEQFGFRLNGGRVEARTAGTSLGCNAGTWVDVTEPTIEVTGLSFVLTETCLNIENTGSACTAGDASETKRRVDVSLTGRLTADPAMQQTVNESVQIRNDRMTP